MKALQTRRSGQDGSVIVIVMLVLALVTVIGVSATNMSTVEMKIANNDKNYKIVFYHSESGNFAMPKWITRVLDKDSVPSEEEDGKKVHRLKMETGETVEDLKHTVYGYADTYDDANDLNFTMTTGVKEGEGTEDAFRTMISNVGIDIRRTRASHAVGGAAEFGTGVKGIGERAAIEIPYFITTEALAIPYKYHSVELTPEKLAEVRKSDSARAAIESKYIKMLGVPGGL